MEGTSENALQLHRAKGTFGPRPSAGSRQCENCVATKAMNEIKPLGMTAELRNIAVISKRAELQNRRGVLEYIAVYHVVYTYTCTYTSIEKTRRVLTIKPNGSVA